MVKEMAGQSERLSRRLEDYLEAVGDLVAAKGSARVRDIAARTGVSMPTVTTSLRQLAKVGLVNYDPYELVTLTDRGQAVSRGIRGRHDALADFLESVLGMDAATAQENACRMEHVVDDAVLGRLALLVEFFNRHKAGEQEWLAQFQKFCQRKEANDEPTGLLRGAVMEVMEMAEKTQSGRKPTLPLANALVGQTVIFAGVHGGRESLLHRLAEMGLTSGVKMLVVNRGPGPFIIEARGSRLVLGQGMVERILVRPELFQDEQ
jgi:DtxR family Mn-dependent transcriptional regulator